MDPPPDLDAVRRKVSDGFAKRIGPQLGEHLEIVLWNWAIDTCRHDGVPLEWRGGFRYRYTSRAVSLRLYWLPHLADKVMAKEVSLKALVYMKPWQVCPDLWEAAFDRMARMQLRREAAVTTALEGMFTCSKCKSKKIAFVQLQTRSADEPMTTYLTCTNCSKRWKE